MILKGIVASIPTTPRALATDVRFADGSWRAPNGENLYQALEALIGRDDAVRVWREACDLFEAPAATPSLQAVGGAS